MPPNAVHTRRRTRAVSRRSRGYAATEVGRDWLQDAGGAGARLFALVGRRRRGEPRSAVAASTDIGPEGGVVTFGATVSIAQRPAAAAPTRPGRPPVPHPDEDYFSQGAAIGKYFSRNSVTRRVRSSAGTSGKLLSLRQKKSCERFFSS